MRLFSRTILRSNLIDLTINHNHASGSRRYKVSVYLRGRSYHYRFQFKGKDCFGACPGCATKAKAKEFEQTVREKISRELETLAAETEKIQERYCAPLL